MNLANRLVDHNERVKTTVTLAERTLATHRANTRDYALNPIVINEVRKVENILNRSTKELNVAINNGGRCDKIKYKYCKMLISCRYENMKKAFQVGLRMGQLEVDNRLHNVTKGRRPVGNINRDSVLLDYAIKASTKRLNDDEQEARLTREEILERGRQQRWSIERIAQELQTHGHAFTRQDALRMARTDTAFGANEGILAALILSGWRHVKWVATHDDILCPYCREIDGDIVLNGIAFVNQGDFVFADVRGKPRQLGPLWRDITHPPLHPNCRCIIRPVGRREAVGA